MMDNQKQQKQTPAAVGSAFNKQRLTTKEFAAALSMQQQSIRSAFCRAGHYMGLVPLRLPNGRLLWDAQGVSRLLN